MTFQHTYNVQFFQQAEVPSCLQHSDSIHHMQQTDQALTLKDRRFITTDILSAVM